MSSTPGDEPAPDAEPGGGEARGGTAGQPEPGDSEGRGGTAGQPEPGDSEGRGGAANRPEPGGREALLAALEVRRNARVALVVGLVFAVLVTLFFLGVVAGGRPGEPVPYYLGLAFVVFVSTALLAATVLTGRRALALTVHPASLVRRGATVGLLGGLAWLGAGLALTVVALGPTGSGAGGGGTSGGGVGRGLVGEGLVGAGTAETAATVAGFLLPWAPLLALGGCWAVHTRYKRVVPARRVAAAGGLLAVPGALLVADLAALELSVLLARPTPPETDVPGLFSLGVGLLALGHTVQGGSAVLAGGGGERRGSLLAAGPLLGLGGLLVLGPGPASLAALATLLGVTWLVVCWPLRAVAEDEVPAPVDPFAA